MRHDLQVLEDYEIHEETLELQYRVPADFLSLGCLCSMTTYPSMNEPTPAVAMKIMSRASPSDGVATITLTNIAR
jgi:hypothetical protein